MKNFKTLLLMLTFILVFSTQSVFANELTIDKEENTEYTFNEKTPKIPNAVEVSIQKRSDNKVRINALNKIGIDKFDLITCNVKITNKNGLVDYNKKITFKNLYPLISQYLDITVYNWSKVEVSNIYCQDGTDTGYLLDFSLSN